MPHPLFTFTSLAGWRIEGDGRASISAPGALRLETWPVELHSPGLTAWAPVILPDSFHLQFDFRAIEGQGWNILFIAATGPAGQDIFDDCRSATWQSYASLGRFRAYTTSFSRGATGFSGIRKISALPGLSPDQMAPILHEGTDLASDPSHPHHIEMIKNGARLRFLVDGHVVHDWTDDARLGPPLGPGRFGLRNFGKPKTADFWNIRVDPSHGDD